MQADENELNQLRALYEFAKSTIKDFDYPIERMFAMKFNENSTSFKGLFNCFICVGKITLFINFKISEAKNGGLLYSFFRDKSGIFRKDYMSWIFFYPDSEFSYITFDPTDLKRG